MRLIYGVLVASIAMCYTNISLAGFAEGMSAYNNKKFNIAFSEFSRLAKSGDVDGQYNLGVLYYYGQGVKKDLVKR